MIEVDPEAQSELLDARDFYVCAFGSRASGFAMLRSLSAMPCLGGMSEAQLRRANASERFGAAARTFALFAVLLGCGTRTAVFLGGENGPGLDAGFAAVPDSATGDAFADVPDSTIADALADMGDERIADVAAEPDAGDAKASDAPLEISILDAPEGAEACEGGLDAGCDPFQVTSTNTVPPAVPVAGPLFFSLESTGCPCGAIDPRACNNSVTLTPGMTIEEKCTALADGIDHACGAGVPQAGFSSDATQCASGSFTVSDPACAGQNGDGSGVTLLLSSGLSTLKDGGFLTDFELDILTNGCQATRGASFAMLAGTASGIATSGHASSVTYAVATPDRGLAQFTLNFAAGETAAAIAAQAVSEMNGALSVVASSVRCAADSIVPSLVTCAVSGAADAGAGSHVTVPVGLAPNDTGLGRVVSAGPATSIAAAERTIRAEGGLPDLLSLNFVGGVTCSPCGDGDADAGVCCR